MTKIIFWNGEGLTAPASAKRKADAAEILVETIERERKFRAIRGVGHAPTGPLTRAVVEEVREEMRPAALGAMPPCFNRFPKAFTTWLCRRATMAGMNNACRTLA